jgi:probable HAF family extracellular repeat protein
MKSRILTCITATTLFAALAIAVRLRLAAQEQSTVQGVDAQHTRYKLIDLGTLGGPNSQVNGSPPPMINNRGVVAGQADTSAPCSYTSDFGGFVSPVFRWENGALTDLGLLPGGCFSLPNSINSKGMIVGSGDIGVIDPMTGLPQIRADFRYKGQVINLGTFGGTNSLANDVNSLGQVVGFAQNTDPDPWASLFFLPPTSYHGFLWQNGVLTDLGTLGGPDSIAGVINEIGQIVGFSFTNSTPNSTTSIPTLDPFLWDRGRMIDLGTLGGTLGFGNQLNNRGQVVGSSDLAGDLASHAFIWEGGVLTDIGTLGGQNSAANVINDAGQVLGTGDLADGTHHAFVWEKGTMTDLGTVGGDPCSNGGHINARGQAIGTSTNCHGTILHIFLWENGSLNDLSSQVLPGSGFAFVEPVAINDVGEIVGNGTLTNGNVHAVLLEPDGPCDSGCEARIAAGHNNVAASIQTDGNSNTAVRERTPSTTLERLRSQMCRRYRMPGLERPRD